MGTHFSGLSLKKWSPGRAALGGFCAQLGSDSNCFGEAQKNACFEGVISRDRACRRFYDT